MCGSVTGHVGGAADEGVGVAAGMLEAGGVTAGDDTDLVVSGAPLAQLTTSAATADAKK